MGPSNQASFFEYYSDTGRMRKKTDKYDQAYQDISSKLQDPKQKKPKKRVILFEDPE